MKNTERTGPADGGNAPYTGPKAVQRSKRPHAGASDRLPDVIQDVEHSEGVSKSNKKKSATREESTISSKDPVMQDCEMPYVDQFLPVVQLPSEAGFSLSLDVTCNKTCCAVPEYGVHRGKSFSGMCLSSAVKFS